MQLRKTRMQWNRSQTIEGMIRSSDEIVAAVKQMRTNKSLERTRVQLASHRELAACLVVCRAAQFSR